MSIVLSGDGSITGLTNTGISAVQKLPTGSVIQVVYSFTTTPTTSTTSTYIDTALSASITPSSSSNKILITIYCGQIYKTANDCQMNFQILRGSTSVFLASSLNQNSATALASNATLVYYDSPSTTSSTTYKIQIANRDNSGTVGFNNNGTATITLMEIAA